MIFNKTWVREAELEELRRLQRLRAMTRLAETEGAVAGAAKTEDLSSDEREPENYSSDESEGKYLKVACSSSSALVPGLGGDGSLAELGKELKANEPVPELGEDKAN